MALARGYRTSSRESDRQKCITGSRKILETGKFSPLHVSELASALGTLEAVAGNRKGARKLIENSLRVPSENAIAQSAWLSRKLGISVPLCNDELNSAEANSWSALLEGKWQLSLEEAIKWQSDQPFSSRPAIHGSHVASTVIQNYALSKEIAELGVLANPDDPSIINNWIFALAMNGDVDVAVRELQRINLLDVTSPQRIALLATSGLVAFRSGKPEDGRRLYRHAIELASATRDRRGSVARINLASEELRIGSDEARTAREEALAASVDITEPWIVHLRNQLDRF